MSRYEVTTGKSPRFWEIKVTGKQIQTRSGRVGSNGRLLDPKVFDTEEQARKKAEKDIAAKLRKDYVLVDDDTSDQAHNPELADAILQSPDADGPYLVYGDWLQSQGDARGELVMVHQQLAARPDDAKLRKTEKKLLGKLAPSRLAQMARKKRSPKKALSGYSDLQWRLGFLDSARVARNTERPPYTIRELVASLLAHPSAQVLRSLTIGALAVKGDYDYSQVVEEIRLAAPVSLRELFLADFDVEEHADMSAVTLGDVSGLYPVLPRLESLHLRAGTMDVGDMQLPSLRALTMTTPLFEERTLYAVADASWPQLARLQLTSGGTCPPLAGLSALLAADGVTRLRELAITHTSSTGDIWRGALADAALLPRLQVLDLSHGDLGDDDARALLAQRDRLQHLQVLDLQANQLSEDMAAALASLCASVRLGNQRPPSSGGLVLTDQQIVEFAPDNRSILAARKIAKPKNWPLLGHDGETVMGGECLGSRGSIYKVEVDVEDMESRCECPSQKYPCKHAISLLILAQSHPIENPLPAGWRDSIDDYRYDYGWE